MSDQYCKHIKNEGVECCKQLDTNCARCGWNPANKTRFRKRAMYQNHLRSCLFSDGIVNYYEDL